MRPVRSNRQETHCEVVVFVKLYPVLQKGLLEFCGMGVHRDIIYQEPCTALLVKLQSAALRQRQHGARRTSELQDIDHLV